MKWAAPRAGVCVWVRRSKWPPGKNSSTLTGAVFVLAAQALDVPQENALGYGARESGAMFYNYFRSYSPSTGRYTQPDPKGLGGGWNRIGYVDGDALNFRDPWGLDRWGAEAWTPARAYTDMSGGTTTYFDPMSGDLLVIPTDNSVASNALPGAAGPYNGEFTYCEHPNSKEYGTSKWRTTDPRARWIHGGGSRLGSKALLPQQGWAPTMGCTRAQNADVDQLCSLSESWKKSNPGKSMPYSRC